MSENEIDYLYDKEQARAWNNRLLREEDRVAFETKILDSLVHKSDSWLDVACGTGFYLSKFKGFKRAGFDLSPEMISIAQQDNPDALFIRVGDYREENKEFTGQWELVSCMWQAYCYVNTMTEFEMVMHNLATWTADNGTCFVPFGAPLGKKTDIPYQRKARSIWGGQVIQSGVIWSWIDEKTGKIHKNLIEPHPDHMRAIFRKYFNIVKVVEYPNQGLYAIIASEKKQPESG